MALSNESYIKAKEILNDVAYSGKSFLPSYEAKSKDDEWKTDLLIFDNWHNGGPEAIWTNIKNPTQEQISKFNSRKNEIGNSSIFDKKGDVVCFGWF